MFIPLSQNNNHFVAANPQSPATQVNSSPFLSASNPPAQARIVDHNGMAFTPVMSSKQSNQGLAMGQLTNKFAAPTIMSRASNSMPWNYGYKSVTVVGFHVQACEAWEDIRQRSMVFDADPMYVRRTKQALERNNHVYNPLLMGMATVGLLGVGNASGVIPMEGGWRERRYRFVLVLRLIPVTTDNYYELAMVAGYSKWFDPSFNRSSVDPNLPFVVGLTQRLSVRTSDGMPFEMKDISKVVSRVDDGNFSNTPLCLVRPEDVAVNMDSNEIMNYVSREYTGDTVLHNNSQCALGVIPEKIGYKNDLVSRWFSTFAQGIAGAHSSRRVDQYTQQPDSGESIGRAAEMIMRGPNGEIGQSIRDPFLQMLTNVTHSPTTVGEFTLTDLTRIDQQVMQKVNVGALENGYVLEGNANYDDPNASGEPSRVAYTIAMGVGVILVNHGCMAAKFTWMNGQPIVLLDAQPLMAGHDVTGLFESFKASLLHELILPAITDKSTMMQTNVILHVDAQLMSRTVVDITYDGINYIIPYPTFAGNRLTTNVADSHHAQSFYQHAINAGEQLFGDY